MKEFLGRDFERHPSKPKNPPFIEIFLTINKEQLKHMESELLAMNLPASAVASVLRLPVGILEESDKQ